VIRDKLNSSRSRNTLSYHIVVPHRGGQSVASFSVIEGCLSCVIEAATSPIEAEQVAGMHTQSAKRTEGDCFEDMAVHAYAQLG
jgi:hypothetical protein